MDRTWGEETRSSEVGYVGVGAGVAGGIVAGVLMGVVVQLGTDLLPVFGRLIGWPTWIGGWLVHLTASALFGLVFALLVSLPFIRGLAQTFAGSVLLGVIHATVLATVLIGIVFPVVSNVLGVVLFPIPGTGIAGGPGEGSIGFLQAVVFAAGNLVYGLVLGAIYALMSGVGPFD